VVFYWRLAFIVAILYAHHEKETCGHVQSSRKHSGHLEKYSLEAGRSAIEVAVVSVSGLMGAGLSSRLFEAATRAIGKTI
jgi:hypothetical protein